MLNSNFEKLTKSIQDYIDLQIYQMIHTNETFAQNSTLSKVAHTGIYSDLKGIPILLTLEKVKEGLADVAISGSYNDLIDKPVGLSEESIKQSILNMISEVGKTGEYDDILNKPDYDNMINQLNERINNINVSNGKSAYDIAVENGFRGTEQDWLDSLKGETIIESGSGNINLSNYYNKGEIDGYLNSKANTNHTHNQYLTEHQSLTGYATETYVNNAINTIPAPDLSNYSTINHTHNQYLTEHQSLEGLATEDYAKSLITTVNYQSLLTTSKTILNSINEIFEKIGEEEPQLTGQETYDFLLQEGFVMGTLEDENGRILADENNNVLIF